GYFGENSPNDVDTGKRYTLPFRRLGFDVRGNTGNVDLTAGVGLGSDRNVGNDDIRIGSEVYFVEGQYVFFPWLIAILRFEDLEFRLPDDSDLLDDREIRRVVASVTALVRANLKFIIEGRIDEGGQDRNGNDALLAALDFAF